MQPQGAGREANAGGLEAAAQSDESGNAADAPLATSAPRALAPTTRDSYTLRSWQSGTTR